MADLETPKALGKLFVIVSDAFHNSFVEKYLSPVNVATRDNSYDNKIVFLEKTKEIFTNGKLFALNNTADVEALTLIVNGLVDLVGDIPADATSTNIVDYIAEYVAGLNLPMTPVTNAEIDALFI